MGDVGKPSGSRKMSSCSSSSCSSSSCSSSSCSSLPSLEAAQNNNFEFKVQPQSIVISEELKNALQRLQSLGRLARWDSNSLTRKLYWFYFRKEIEDLSETNTSAENSPS